MANAFADILRQAARLCEQDSRRDGNVVRLQQADEVIVTGDLHGNRHNLHKIVDYADLSANSGRILVLQEIIHGPPDRQSGHDRSIELLIRAARLKIAHPENVLFILGNHDIAQVTGNEITKDGLGVCREFVQGAAYALGDYADETVQAAGEFLLSYPISVRCPSGVMISHSLPSPKHMAACGCSILAKRAYEQADLHRGGGAYEWTWGRSQEPEQLESLAAELGVEFFVVGHRHSGAGYELIPDRGISIASDHEHGVILQFAGDQKLNIQNVESHLKPINALLKADIEDK